MYEFAIEDLLTSFTSFERNLECVEMILSSVSGTSVELPFFKLLELTVDIHLRCQYDFI